MELKRDNLEEIMDQYNKALSLARKANDLNLEYTVLDNKESTLKKYGRDDLAGIHVVICSFLIIFDTILMNLLDQVRGEIEVIKACLPSQELDLDSEASDEVEVPEEVDLEEILGKLFLGILHYRTKKFKL